MQFRHYLPSSHASVFLQRQGLRSIQNSMLRLLTINFLGRHVQGVRHVKTSSTVLLGSIRAVAWQLELQPSPNVVLTNLISSMSLNAYQRPQHILRQLKVCAAHLPAKLTPETVLRGAMDVSELRAGRV